MPKQECDKVVSAEWILTQDDSRTVLQDGAVAVLSGKVAAVGPREDISAVWTGAETLDLGRSLLLPGLINSHTHAPMTLLRGIADDLPLMVWLSEHIWPLEADLDRELIKAGAMLACAEMVASGTTCFLDMYFHESLIAEAVRTVGMRGVLGEGLLTLPTPSYKDTEKAFELNVDLIESLAGEPLVDACIAVHSVYTSDEDMILRGFELADTYDIPWSIHLSETEQEVSECLEKHGKTPPAYLDSLGCLTPRSLLIHCCHLSDEEITLMAERGCGVAHQPESNMKLASGTARAQSMLDAGVTVCLGTDGAASNNNLDMFGEMTTTALLQKSHLKEPTAMPAQSVLDMATRNGATCLMRPDLGRIEPGSAADFTALDLERPSLLPVYNPVSHAVYAATGGDVRLTMVAGRVLYRDGRFPTFDYPALVDEVRSIGRSIDRKKRT